MNPATKVAALLAFVQKISAWLLRSNPEATTLILKQLISLVPADLEPELLAIVADLEKAGTAGINAAVKHVEALLAAVILGLDPTKV